MAWMKAALLAIAVLLLHSLAHANGQKPTWADVTFDPAVNRRGDWCPQMIAVNNGTMNLRDVMRGIKLSISIPDPIGYTPVGFVNVDADGAIMIEKEGGFMIEVLDELARRAGFTWRDSFAFFSTPESFGKTWTELVQWQIQAYDMSGEWWIPTIGRRQLGISFLQGFYDSSLVLIEKSAGKKIPSFGEKLASWAGPLSPLVWGMSVIAAICVGIAYWIIENKEEGSDLDHEVSAHNALLSCFSAVLLFTGGGGPAPRTFAGQFLMIGWSLFILVVVNGYAANLVAFLVQKAPPLYPMADIMDGHVRGLPVCVWTSAAPGPIMKDLYPNLNVVSGSPGTMIKQMRDGECQGVIHTRDTWTIQQSLKEHNEDCQLAKIGDTIYPSSAGWAVKMDSGVMCTSIIRDVMDIYLVEMELDGFIKTTKRKWMALPSTTNHSCADGGGDEEDSETTPLGLNRFEGIFEILALVIVISVVWGLVAKRFARPTDIEGEESTVTKKVNVMKLTAEFTSDLVDLDDKKPKTTKPTSYDLATSSDAAGMAQLQLQMNEIEKGVQEILATMSKEKKKEMSVPGVTSTHVDADMSSIHTPFKPGQGNGNPATTHEGVTVEGKANDTFSFFGNLSSFHQSLSQPKPGLDYDF